MIYAYLTDGLDAEQKEQFDVSLNEKAADEKSKAKRERQALAQVERFLR